jgi:cytoskeletal protein RodZ
MKKIFSLTAIAFLYMVFALSSCSVQDEKTAKPATPAPAAPAPAAKAEKAPPAEKAPAEKAPAEKAVAEKTEKAPDEKTAEKAKATKVSGDVGLLDVEKNYMILVTKEGKLITLDFDNKTKVTEIQPTPAKIADVGLGSSAVVQYTKEGDKNIAANLEYKPAKGGD